MMFKEEWKDLVDGVSEINVDDINQIAHQAIKNEENIINIGKKVDEANAELENILAGGVD